MPRVQVGYDPRAEALQTTAAPNIRAVKARFDPRDSSAYQLAEALGAKSVQQGLADALSRSQENDVKNAKTDINSLTAGQLAEKVKSGEILASKSPVYRATIEHVDGENDVNKVEQELTSKLTRGEIFKDPEDLEDYLIKERNKALAGKSQFAIAGFDKSWAQFRQRAAVANNKAIDGQYMEKNQQVAADSFSKELDDSKREGLQPADKVTRLIGKYDLLRSSSVLSSDKSQERALKDIALRLSSDGDTETLKLFLDTKLPNNGPSIRAKLGTQDSEIILKSGEANLDKKIREVTDDEFLPLREQANEGIDPATFDKRLEEFYQPRKKYISSETVAGLKQRNRAAVAQKAATLEKINKKLVEDNEDAQAVQLMEQRIADGKPVMDLTTPSGRVLKAQDLGEAAMGKIIRANPDMPFAEQVRRYALGGVDNKAWKREFGTALFNIGEVNIDATGKRTGDLMPATTEALDRFAMVRQVSEGYARDLAGGDKNYEMLTHIQALRENGIGDVNMAAALVNQKARRNMSAKVWGNIQEEVTTELEKTLNPGVFSQRFWGELFRGEFGNSEKNVLPIKNGVRSLAETYLGASVAKDGKDAVRMAGEYYAKPSITTQINNTIYLNKDLPELPAGVDRTAWFSKAMDEYVGGKLKTQGIKYNRSDLTLIPQEGGNAPYLIALRGQPTGEYVTKKEIADWVTSKKDQQDTEDADRLSAPKPKGIPSDPTKPAIFFKR